MEAIAYDERGLVPCVIQDARTGEVLTRLLALMGRRRLCDRAFGWYLDQAHPGALAAMEAR